MDNNKTSDIFRPISWSDNKTNTKWSKYPMIGHIVLNTPTGHFYVKSLTRNQHSQWYVSIHPKSSTTIVHMQIYHNVQSEDIHYLTEDHYGLMTMTNIRWSDQINHITHQWTNTWSHLVLSGLTQHQIFHSRWSSDRTYEQVYDKEQQQCIHHMGQACYNTRWSTQ